MELIKELKKVDDANGWYLAESVITSRIENYKNPINGEITELQRYDTILNKGILLSEIDISVLKENNVENVLVSNIMIKSDQIKRMNLWETVLNVRYKVEDKEKKQSFIVTSNSPTHAEYFIVRHFEKNIESGFEVIKVNQLSYQRVIKLGNEDVEKFLKKGNSYLKLKWYNVKVESVDKMFKLNVLVYAKSFVDALNCSKILIKNQKMQETYTVFTEIKELKIVDAFIPDSAVFFYTQDELDTLQETEYNMFKDRQYKEMLERIDRVFSEYDKNISKSKLEGIDDEDDNQDESDGNEIDR